MSRAIRLTRIHALNWYGYRDSIAVEGNKITLVITISYNGTPMIITYNGKIDGAKMEGEADFGGLATGCPSPCRHRPA